TWVLLLTLLVIAWAERTYPANPDWNYRLLSGGGVRGWSAFGRDLLYLFVIAQVSAALIALTAFWLKPHLTSWATGKAIWPSALPFAVRVLLAFFVVELLSYLLHRAAHHLPL